MTDYANFTKNGKPILLKVKVPTAEQGGMPQLLDRLAEVRPELKGCDYEVFRDWHDVCPAPKFTSAFAQGG